MARSSTTTATSSGASSGADGTIIDIDVAEEMRGSFLEYAYSVIYSRALPDARDGLKPVHRRILFMMAEMGLRPDRGHVKSARVVGEVMGKLHPHGDGAIYEALVRMAQWFSMRVPLVDGHGNFGSLGNDDPPAAMRYTECRLAPAARLMTDSLDEDVVDMNRNYDERELEPEVLPAAYPNLLVNGTSGIAVGMATNMAPHNLVEVIAAARHLIANPKASLDDLMRIMPGPDLPTGGQIVGLDGIREAYETGRGVFRMRATARIEDVTSRRKGIVVTELPYMIGPEKVVAKIKELVQAKRLQGIADVKDLTDRKHGLRLVIEIRSGFQPSAVLSELYRLTPMEESFGINAVALVDGQPRTLGIKELLQVYVDHRLIVVKRRSAFRRKKAADRAHIVEGLLLALTNIDEVIQVIRTSQDTEEARERLKVVFDLSDIQAGYILDMPLRRLTALEVHKLQEELAELRETIAGLDTILGSDSVLRELVSDELAGVSDEYGTERRTVLLEATPTFAPAGGKGAVAAMEIPDAPCQVLLSSTGLLARTPAPEEATELDTGAKRPSGRVKHDVIVSTVSATTRGEVGAVTSAGRVVRISVIDLPALPPTGWAPNLRGGAPVKEFLDLQRGERVLCLMSVAEDGPGVLLGTAQGTVKRLKPGGYPGKVSFEIITLKDGDEVVGACEISNEAAEVVLITSDAQLLRTPLKGISPQGMGAAGMAGIKVAPGQKVLSVNVVDPRDADAVVVTIAVSSAALPGTDPGSGKVTPLSEYPAKGRATGGVRCQRFLKGEDELSVAWAGVGPPLAAGSKGEPVELPVPDPRRDASGARMLAPVAAVGALPSSD